MERTCRVSVAPAAGEGISHLFGIYRSRTPDIKKSRLIRIRFIFVPVILGSLLLVVFLTIIDVTRSSSNTKSLPYARLSHLYPYDSARRGRQNYTNGETDEKIRNHNQKNTTEISIDNEVQSRQGNDELDSTGNETIAFNRTRLHHIQNSVNHLSSLLMARENILNRNENIKDLHNTDSSFYDFTSDNNQELINVNENEKIDRRGRAYFDSNSRRFSDAESTGGLHNNKRQMLRTGRIMNNPKSTYMNYNSSDPLNIGSQYLNAPFSTYPIYGNTFAQLGPYQRVKNIKSIGDILKYVAKQNPSNIYITSTVTPETVAVKKAVKFTGTYKMPSEDEPGNSFGGPINQNDFKGYSSYYSQSYPFYDPFKNFKPVNPSEINKLISTGTNTDQIASPSNKVYFTEPSSIFDFPSTTPRPFYEVDKVHNNQSRYHSLGSHTIAVFKPLEPTNSYGLGFTTQMPAEITNRKTKPLSVTLDIYPMTVERDQVSSGNSPQPSYQLTPPNKNRPTHPRWNQRPVGPLRGPRFRKPIDALSQNNGGPENHMIVHLNVFPNRSEKQLRQGRGRGINKSVLNSVIAGGTFGHRSFDNDDPVEGHADYVNIDSSLESNDTSERERNTFYLTRSNDSDSADVDLQEKVYYELKNNTVNNVYGGIENGDSDLSDDEDHAEMPTTSTYDVETTTNSVL